jgi:predicted O-methyltransferase YrrM
MDQLLKMVFRGMDGGGKLPGSEMSAHMPTLYMLARHWSFGPLVECGVGEGFSTVALLAGATEGGGRLTSYDLELACRAAAVRNMGLKGDDPRLAAWHFVTKHSVSAAQDWADESVALFFLDTSHFLEDTRRELSAWLPKMHPRGVICGHDYYLENYQGVTYNVKEAVDEFARQHSARFRLQVFRYDQGLFALWPNEF